MIRVLVVDDDFRVAALHSSFVGQIPGFTAVGVAHSAQEAVEAAARLRPDLVLLDQYLPDGLGTAVLAQLRTDTIMLTAASDTATVRAALSAGALNYLAKPFTAAQLAERLAAYARYRHHLTGERDLAQEEIDRAVALLHDADAPAAALPKGRSPVTAQRILAALRAATGPMTAVEIADSTGVSRATAQRYLGDLAHSGKVELSLRYGSTGRPEHLYRWRGQPVRVR
ncbi:transcriptional regulatory protein [Catellatospora sp. TT07R-123]|uniref:response regulator n=1 Tax=Catellatospora sp. TT07R-123 TaxID=2733863 RepID=UPI001B259CCF|nr:response regulator [Catellatospora sp. TT07R-123]GHJ43383.1 transcriptional regulatory protein [Catellatospora sp. TT07R-123]